MERTFILKIDTDNQDWRNYLSKHLSQLAEETDAGIKIYELNDEGVKKVEQIITQS